MSQLPEPTDPRHVRASDTDRYRVADLLRDAAAEGRLSMDELEERLDGVFAAKTYAELEPYTRDLPVGAGGPQPAPAPARHPEQRIGGTPAHSVSVAIMSGATRKGPWVVPPAYTAVAFCGGVELDLRDARFATTEVVIRAFAMMGGIEITVSDDVDVSVVGVGIMGGFEDTASTGRTDANRPLVRVTGLAFWGGVSVKRKPRKQKQQPAIEKD